MSIHPKAVQEARPASVLRRRPVLIFFVLSYVFSWALWAPLAIVGGDLPGALDFLLRVLGSAVPSALAVVFVAALHGKRAVMELLGQLLLWRVGLRWYLVVLAVTLLVPCAFAVSVLFGGSFPALGLSIPLVLLTLVLSTFPGSAMGEEIGWRGFVLPRLQARHSALGASIGLGVVWGMWHLPLWLSGAPSHPLGLFPAFVISVVAMSVLYTWLYNSTGGSLLIVVLFHAVTNLPLSLFPDALVGGTVPPLLIYMALMVLTATVVAITCGPADLSRHHQRLVATDR
jgi:membrane protease YdiL (CAAX protease family)